MNRPETQDDLGYRFAAMACDGEVRLCGFSPVDAGPLAQRAIDEVLRIERKYSRYRDDSVIARINTAAGAGLIKIDPETAALFDYAEQLHALSSGLFDITSGILRRAWDFKQGRMPQPGELEQLLPYIGQQYIRREGKRIGLAKAGMQLDFGGFGKEYAVDRAASLLYDAGARHGFVNIGGDLRIIGPRPNGEPWSFGIQHPRRATEVIASLELSSGALATSGDYERYFERDGVRYCHILNPHTGWPVSSWQSISVAAPVCLGAGALTTIAMLLGARAIEFLNAQNVAYLAIDAQDAMLRKSL